MDFKRLHAIEPVGNEPLVRQVLNNEIHIVAILSVTLIADVACGGNNTSARRSPPAPPAAFSQTELTAGSGAQAGKGAAGHGELHRVDL